MLGGSRSTGSVVARGVPLGPTGGHRRGGSARNNRRPCCPSAELSGAPATPGTVDSPAPSYLVIELCSRLRVRRVCVGRCHGPGVPISPRVSTSATCLFGSRHAGCEVSGWREWSRTHPTRAKPSTPWSPPPTTSTAVAGTPDLLGGQPVGKPPSPRERRAFLVPHQGHWTDAAARLLARLVHAEPPRILRTDHVGWISVPGLDAKTARHRLPHDTRSSALKRPDISALRRSFTSPMTRPRRGTRFADQCRKIRDPPRR